MNYWHFCMWRQINYLLLILLFTPASLFLNWLNWHKQQRFHCAFLFVALSLLLFRCLFHLTRIHPHAIIIIASGIHTLYDSYSRVKNKYYGIAAVLYLYPPAPMINDLDINTFHIYQIQTISKLILINK